MRITITTPALLFPAISLLFLAYSNRFHALASLLRDLHARYKSKPDPGICAQMKNLQYRIGLIKNMQLLCVAAFFLCVLSMLILFLGQVTAGEIVFGLSLVLLLLSLGIAMRELQVSVNALNLQTRDTLGEG